MIERHIVVRCDDCQRRAVVPAKMNGPNERSLWPNGLKAAPIREILAGLGWTRRGHRDFCPGCTRSPKDRAQRRQTKAQEVASSIGGAR